MNCYEYFRSTNTKELDGVESPLRSSSRGECVGVSSTSEYTRDPRVRRSKSPNSMARMRRHRVRPRRMLVLRLLSTWRQLYNSCARCTLKRSQSHTGLLFLDVVLEGQNSEIPLLVRSVLLFTVCGFTRVFTEQQMNLSF